MWRTRTINRKRFFGTKAHFIANTFVHITKKRYLCARGDKYNSIPKVYQAYTKGRQKNVVKVKMHTKNAAAALIFAKKFVCLEKNSNLMHALSSNTNIGTIRETFFCNQLLEAGHEVNLAKKGDFIVDSQYTFEVGGGSKTFKQIRDVQDSYLAVDNTPIGDVNRIPLWLFGFLY